MRSMHTSDHLGHLIPAGRLRRPHLEQGLRSAMNKRRAAETPSRFVVAMHPADLAWLDPTLPDLLARSLQAAAGAPRSLVVEFEAKASLSQGCPQFWAGFAGDDLLVLAESIVPSRELTSSL